MQPFILLPIGIQNQDKEQKDVTARFQPDQIDYYYPGFFSGTVIVNKSGNSFFTPLSIKEIDEVLTEYSKKTQRFVLKAGPDNSVIKETLEPEFGILEIKIKK